jgi:hypothetical protein
MKEKKMNHLGITYFVWRREEKLKKDEVAADLHRRYIKKSFMTSEEKQIWETLNRDWMKEYISKFGTYQSRKKEIVE